MDDYDKCAKCKDEDHEGKEVKFCRCENRNIRIAKEARARGVRLWDIDKSLSGLAQR